MDEKKTEVVKRGHASGWPRKAKPNAEDEAL